MGIIIAYSMKLFYQVSMVVPIIVGAGVTILALTAKSTLAAYQKYVHLTPQMIASLNNIILKCNHKIDFSHPHYTVHREIVRRYPEKMGFKEKMNEQEALEIMGIRSDEIMNFNKTYLKQRYRKLIILNHPDKNGSKYLTQKINQAKDILEKSYMFNDEK